MPKKLKKKTQTKISILYPKYVLAFFYFLISGSPFVPGEFFPNGKLCIKYAILCVCMYMSAHLICASMCTYMWQSKVDIQCLSFFAFHILYFQDKVSH